MRLAPVLALSLISCSSTSNEQPSDQGTDQTQDFRNDLALEGVDLQQDVAGDPLPDISLPPLVWSGCGDVTPGFPKPSPEVQCASIEVPLDHDSKGDPLTLRIARHKSKAFPTGKALFFLAGGPGGGAVDQSGMMPSLVATLRDSFDLVYMDQRGAGGSGAMYCSNGYPTSKAEWKTCAGEHNDKALDHYLTMDAVRDLELVRQRLGYDEIYIRAGSYGTAVALQYLRQHEDRVVAIVLDGLVPPDWDLFGDMLKAGDRIVAKLIADCEGDTDCKAVSPDLAADLDQRRQQLKENPRLFKIGTQLFSEDDVSFSSLLGMLIDRARWYYKLPRAIHQAVLGNNAQWNQLLSELLGSPVTDEMIDSPPEVMPRFRWSPQRLGVLGLDDGLSEGLMMTILCAEFLPNSEGLASLKSLHDDQTWKNSDTMPKLEGCASWQVSTLSGQLRSPVQSSARVLLFSGEIDRRTPSKNGAHAVKTLPGGTHLVIPYASHSTLRVPCAAKIMVDFIAADGVMQGVDTSCIDEITHPAW